MQDDVLIRFEVVKVLGHRVGTTQEISELVYDAKCLYDFIKEGKEIVKEGIVTD